MDLECSKRSFIDPDSRRGSLQLVRPKTADGQHSKRLFQEPDDRRESLAFFRFLLTFEYIFESTGQGLFQFLIIVFTSVIECSIGLTLFTSLTEGETFGWKWDCSAPSGDRIEVDDQSEKYDWCPSSADSCSNITYLSGTTTIATEWNLVCAEGDLARLTTVLFFAGSIGGSLINGQLADVFGRRKMTLIFWILMMVLQATSGLSVSWFMYLACRIGAGICVGACIASNSVIAVEYMSPKTRVIAAQKFGLSFALLLTSLFLFFIKSWRWRSGASGLLMAPFIPVLIILLPESTRWLLQKDRVPEAAKIVRKIAKYNRKSLPNLNFLTRIAELSKLERKGHDLYTYLDLFASRKYVIRTLSLVFLSFSEIFLQTCQEITVTALHPSAKLAVLGATMFIGKGVNLFIANRFGRKRAYISNVIVVIFIIFAMLLVDLLVNEHKQIIMTSLASVSLMSLCGISMIVFCFTMETYPTLLRATTSGVASTFSEAGGIIAYYVPLLTVYHSSIPYVIHFITLIVSAILVGVVMPETRGRDLQEDLPQGQGQGCCSRRSSKDEESEAGPWETPAKEMNNLHGREKDYFVMDFTKPKSPESAC